MVLHRSEPQNPVPRRQDEVLSLEEQLLSHMKRLVSELPPNDPYRAVIERHLPRVQEAVSQLQSLFHDTERR
jgi:hypothetical protein